MSLHKISASGWFHRCLLCDTMEQYAPRLLASFGCVICRYSSNASPLRALSVLPAVSGSCRFDRPPSGMADVTVRSSQPVLTGFINPLAHVLKVYRCQKDVVFITPQADTLIILWLMTNDESWWAFLMRVKSKKPKARQAGQTCLKCLFVLWMNVQNKNQLLHLVHLIKLIAVFCN